MQNPAILDPSHSQVKESTTAVVGGSACISGTEDGTVSGKTKPVDVSDTELLSTGEITYFGSRLQGSGRGLNLTSIDTEMDPPLPPPPPPYPSAMPEPETNAGGDISDSRLPTCHHPKDFHPESKSDKPQMLTASQSTAQTGDVSDFPKVKFTPPIKERPKGNKTAAPAKSSDVIELQSDVPKVRMVEEIGTEPEKKAPVPAAEIPNTNFAIACMVALCFNLPFGMLAMYCSLKAVKAYQESKDKVGESRSRWSIILSLLGITVTTVIISSVVLYIAVKGQKRISRQKSFGLKSGLNL